MNALMATLLYKYLVYREDKFTSKKFTLEQCSAYVEANIERAREYSNLWRNKGLNYEFCCLLFLYLEIHETNYSRMHQYKELRGYNREELIRGQWVLDRCNQELTDWLVEADTETTLEIDQLLNP